MLRHLSIRAFALIEHVECSFSDGMTVLLGETGAGKSIIIDALAAALGERMSSDQLRTGARKAVIEATFRTAAPDVQALLAECELSWEHDDLVFRRELTASGTSRCFVNDTPTQAAVVRQLAALLMDFHGQHDTHGLLHASRHLSIIDAVGGLARHVGSMTLAWRDLAAVQSALQDLRARAETADADMHRMTFQLEELTSVSPKPDEDEQIIAELRRAESSEQVVTAATALREALYTGADTAYDRLSTALRQVDALTSLAPELARFRDELEAAMTLCREAAQSAAPLADPEDFSAERIEDLRTRLMLLQRLIRKYGSLQEARATQERLASAVNGVEHLDEALEAAHQAMTDCMKTAKTAAAALSKARKAVVPTLAASVTTALHDMGMPSARVEITHATGELRSTGIDEIEVLFTGNAGESPRPLTKVASGGELSRVMLAIKRAMAVRGAIGTMVFDEIDTGISGKVARHVGEVMKDLSTQHQILCITHLPQIASLADHVIRVSKHVEGSSTTVSAERIYGDDAVLEIARLMSGVAVTDAAIDSARDLMTATKR